jgi:hypothetical protein
MVVGQDVAAALITPLPRASLRFASSKKKPEPGVIHLRILTAALLVLMLTTTARDILLPQQSRRWR